MDNIKPFNFVEYDLEKASIILEADMKYQLFEKYGIEPNGYSWEKVIQKYIEKNHSDIENNISYDSESGMFACNGSKDTMKDVVYYLVKLYNNEPLLEKLISLI